MKLGSVAAAPLAIPFRVAFRHASAERSAMQSLWVEAHAQEGATGYGEGCPREYVTSENLATAQAFVNAHIPEWTASIRDIDTLAGWVTGHRELIDANPAAWSAVELALLDLIGKCERKSVESLLGLPPVSGRFRYTAVLGDAAPREFAAQLAHYRKAGFSEFKIKLSGNPERDRAKAEALTTAGISAENVRADANNLWHSADDAIAALQAVQFPFRALEEPLPAGDYEGMSRLAAALGTRIVLDESLLRSDQLDRLPGSPERWIANLRISKMGGVLRSLDLVRALRECGMPLIIGAHVGETSVLTRAALTVAQSARDLLIAQEGAFGTHLLSYDVAEPPLMFGPGGLLDASLLHADAPGFGLSVVRAPDAGTGLT
ncbi:MAG: mandelate racemase/muconate lactonizing enzyme family protein [Betaproteobacteria bacterium]